MSVTTAQLIAERERYASVLAEQKRLEAGLKGVVERGKANLNDKTMVAALTPAIERPNSRLNEGASNSDARAGAADAAETG
jgi:phosphoenolpyruvate---glycerone phosphotransferase subunit DhaL